MEQLEQFKLFLEEQEKSESTCIAYARAVQIMLKHCKSPLTKEKLVQYRSYLSNKYKPSTVNVAVAAFNQYAVYMGKDWKLHPVRTQRKIFTDESKLLTKEEYIRLISACQKNERLSLLLQTVCATGIRISELKYIRAEVLNHKKICVTCKGKTREILLPDQLIKKLKQYCYNKKIKQGEIFITSSGKPIDRSNIWRSIKRLCNAANVAQSKAFPHNLRHLFAISYYQQEKDIVKLADILGHSRVETTRLYLICDGTEHRQQMDNLGLVV